MNLRNDLKPARIHEFFKQHFASADEACWSGASRMFQCLLRYVRSVAHCVDRPPVLGSMQTMIDGAAADKNSVAACARSQTAELPYVRYDSVLLKAFDAHPK